MLDILFESPNPLIGLAILLEAVFLILWLCNREKYRSYLLLVGPVLVAAAFALDALVETNRESLTRVTQELIDATAEGSAPHVIARLSDTFRLDNGMDKNQLAAIVTQRLAQPLIENNHINSLTVIQAEKNQGTVEVSVTTLIDPKAPENIAVIRIIKTSWRFEYVRQDNHYRLEKLIMLSINDQEPVDIFRM